MNQRLFCFLPKLVYSPHTLIKMNKLFLVPLLIFASFFCYSQTNYKPGYVVYSTGDTVRGYVDYKEWFINPSKINFSKDQDKSNKESLSTDEILAFGVDGAKNYERHTVSISVDRTELHALQANTDSSKIVDQVFLQLISKGNNVSLYYYKDDIKERFYISDRTEPQPRELEIHYYLLGRIVKSKKNYIHELLRTAEKFGLKNDAFVNQATTIDYSRKGFLKILKGLNDEEKMVQTVKNSGQKSTQLFLGARLAVNHLFYKGEHFLAQKDADHANYISPGINIGFNWYRNRDIQKLYFRLEVSALQLNSKTSLESTSPYYPTLTGPGVKRMSHSTKILSFSILPTCQYNIYNQERYRFFIGAGAGVNFLYYRSNEFKTSIRNGDFIEYPGIAGPDLFRNLLLSVPLNMGFNYRERFQFCANLNTSPLASTTKYTIRSQTFSLNLNYLFR